MMTCKRFALSICFLGALALPVAQAGESSPATSEQITITDVQVRISDHGAVVLLLAEGKAIPIFVDLTVALSIQGRSTARSSPPPLARFDAYDPGGLWRESVAYRHHVNRWYLLWRVDRCGRGSGEDV